MTNTPEHNSKPNGLDIKVEKVRRAAAGGYAAVMGAITVGAIPDAMHELYTENYVYGGLLSAAALWCGSIAIESAGIAMDAHRDLQGLQGDSAPEQPTEDLG